MNPNQEFLVTHDTEYSIHLKLVGRDWEYHALFFGGKVAAINYDDCTLGPGSGDPRPRVREILAVGFPWGPKPDRVYVMP